MLSLLHGIRSPHVPNLGPGHGRRSSVGFDADDILPQPEKVWISRLQHSRPTPCSCVLMQLLQSISWDASWLKFVVGGRPERSLGESIKKSQPFTMRKEEAIKTKASLLSSHLGQ
jgi:hypothetical protein